MVSQFSTSSTSTSSILGGIREWYLLTALSHLTFLGAIRDARLLDTPWERHGRRRSGGDQIYETHLKPRKMFIKLPASPRAIRRGQGACKFSTAVCILRVLDSAQLSRWTSRTRFRGRDGGQCTTPAAPREGRKGGTKGRKGIGTGERGTCGGRAK